jgi:tetratricopeptide (TPR) repeat protein
MGDLFIDASEPEERRRRVPEGAARRRLGVAPDETRGGPAASGDFDAAITELRAAIKIEPASARAHSGLGLALRAQCNLPESTAAYQQAIRLDPDLIDAHNGLAVVLANQGKLNEAVAEFREIIRVDPDSAIGLLQPGLCPG